jgi:molecular chaperone DnaJ
MATVKRDYYEVLKVSREADAREIKKAFLRLARELHPDVSEEPGAEERFREVTEAYEVLSKPETRGQYDRFGHDGLRSGGFRPTTFDFTSLGDIFSALFGEDIFGAGGPAAGRAGRGGDILVEIEIELVEAAEGVTRAVPFPVSLGCDACDGSGAEPGTSTETCATCGGAGRLQAVSNSPFGQFIRTQACSTCGGRGQVIPTPCRACGGDGLVVEERSIDVEVPPGIHDGQRIRLSGEGHAGVLGGRAGDLYVHVHVLPDPLLVRDGNDIVSALDLTMTQAALGGTFTIPTLNGDLDLDLKPGAQPGDVRVLRGKGMPVLQGFGRGDHRLVLNVAVPRHLTDEQRGALEAFERLAGEETYRRDDGFLDKLRAAFR